MGTSGSVSSTSVPGTSTHMRRRTARGAASDSGPLCGGPDGLPRGSTVSQVADCSGERGNLISSQSAMCGCLHRCSVGREAALDRVNKIASGVHEQKTVQVEFRGANSDQAGQAEVIGGLAQQARRGGVLSLIGEGWRVITLGGETAWCVGA